MTTLIPPLPHAGIVQHGPERRRAERTEIHIQALLRFQDRLQVLQGSVCDLSVGGTGFICHQALAAHAKCSLQFMLPAIQHMPAKSANLQATVINSMQVIGQPHHFRVNLQFSNLPPNVRSHIEALIRLSLSRG